MRTRSKGKRMWNRLAVWSILLAGGLMISGCGCFAPAEEPQPQPKQGCDIGQPGDTMVWQAYPTGNKETSAVLVQKAAPSAKVRVGQPTRYEICVTNLTGLELANVKVYEQMPAGLRLESSTPQAKVSGNKVMWELGTIAAHASEKIEARVIPERTGELMGCTTVTYDPPLLCLTIEAVQPALSISLAMTDEMILCDPVKMTVTVKNTGTGPAENVMVRVPMPAGMQTLDGSSTAMVNVGTLTSGQSRSIDLQGKVMETGSYTVQATATAEGGLEARSNTQSTMVRTPALVISASGPDVRYLDRPATYDITVTNTGDAAATDVVLEESLDLAGGARFISATDGGQSRGDMVVWQLGTIPPGGRKTVSMTVQPTQVGEIRTLATATAYCTRAEGSTATRVQGIPAVLLECVDMDDPIEVGNVETYQITVTNQGSAVDTNIQISATLPSQMEFVSASGPGINYNVSGQTVTFDPLPSLAPKAKAIFTVRGKAVRTGDVRFSVTLKTDQITSPVQETEATNLYE